MANKTNTQSYCIPYRYTICSNTAVPVPVRVPVVKRDGKQNKFTIVLYTVLWLSIYFTNSCIDLLSLESYYVNLHIKYINILSKKRTDNYPQWMTNKKLKLYVVSKDLESIHISTIYNNQKYISDCIVSTTTLLGISHCECQ
jgi:hypothetical protein